MHLYFESYFIELNWVLELLPELLLVLYILYSLVSIFNDLEQSMFQYYR
jgi:hypothetical protein